MLPAFFAVAIAHDESPAPTSEQGTHLLSCYKLSPLPLPQLRHWAPTVLIYFYSTATSIIDFHVETSPHLVLRTQEKRAASWVQGGSKRGADAPLRGISTSPASPSACLDYSKIPRDRPATPHARAVREDAGGSEDIRRVTAGQGVAGTARGAGEGARHAELAGGLVERGRVHGVSGPGGCVRELFLRACGRQAPAESGEACCAAAEGDAAVPIPGGEVRGFNGVATCDANVSVASSLSQRR